MSDVEHKPYAEVMERVGELADSLLNNPDPKVAARTEEMLDWIDTFHREGLSRLVGLIISWRGELFLETVSADDIAGTFLATYDLTDEVLDDASMRGSGS
ncbi:MAG: hypothetical protein M3011_09075 [Actinomycetota bacterium]|nr:hypothetical protein [Actinomycetota bacterium]